MFNFIKKIFTPRYLYKYKEVKIINGKTYIKNVKKTRDNARKEYIKMKNCFRKMFDEMGKDF